MVRTTRGLKKYSKIMVRKTEASKMTMFSALELCVPLFLSNRNCAYHYFSRRKYRLYKIGESIIWTTLKRPELVAEADSHSRKLEVLGPLFFSIICIFDLRFLTHLRFSQIPPPHIDPHGMLDSPGSVGDIFSAILPRKGCQTSIFVQR